MDNFDLEIHRSPPEYFPGEQITGTVRWVFSQKPPSIEIFLFWHTEGKGTRDAETMGKLVWENVEAFGEKDFEFSLPEAPHSFHGQLISLEWGIEALVTKSRFQAYEKFILSPTGKSIILGDPDTTPEDKPVSPLRKIFSFSFNKR